MKPITLVLALFLVTACESEQAKRERIEAVVESSIAKGAEADFSALDDEELVIAQEIFDQRLANLGGQSLGEIDAITARLMQYAAEDRAFADALTEECEALFGPFSDPANTYVVADCVDRAWQTK
jgi:hypothetical protein